MNVDRLIDILQTIQKVGRGKEKVQAFDPDENEFCEVSSLHYGAAKPGKGVVEISTYATESYCMITDNVKYYSDSEGILKPVESENK